MQLNNVEIKARCSYHDPIREYLKGLNATENGTDHQIDTYFKCNYSKLKLQEGNIENNLIQYHLEKPS